MAVQKIKYTLGDGSTDSDKKAKQNPKNGLTDEQITEMWLAEDANKIKNMFNALLDALIENGFAKLIGNNIVLDNKFNTIEFASTKEWNDRTKKATGDFAILLENGDASLLVKTSSGDKIFWDSVKASIELAKKQALLTSGQLAVINAEVFSSALKTKLEGLTNFDDTSIQATLTKLTNDMNQVKASSVNIPHLDTTHQDAIVGNTTNEKLKTMVPDAVEGDVAYVGTSGKWQLWRFDNTNWIETGAQSAHATVANDPTKASIVYVDGELAKKQNALTPEQINKINNAITSHQDISGKADLTWVINELAKKQDKELEFYINGFTHQPNFIIGTKPNGFDNIPNGEKILLDLSDIDLLLAQMTANKETMDNGVLNIGENIRIKNAAGHETMFWEKPTNDGVTTVKPNYQTKYLVVQWVDDNGTRILEFVEWKDFDFLDDSEIDKLEKKVLKTEAASGSPLGSNQGAGGIA